MTEGWCVLGFEVGVGGDGGSAMGLEDGVEGSRVVDRGREG